MYAGTVLSVFLREVVILSMYRSWSPLKREQEEEPLGNILRSEPGENDMRNSSLCVILVAFRGSRLTISSDLTVSSTIIVLLAALLV
jgi:hypothetical protein